MLYKVLKKSKLRMAIIIISLQMLTSFAVLSFGILDYLHSDLGYLDNFTYRIIFNLLILLDVIGCSGDFFIAFKYLKAALSIQKPGWVKHA